MRSFRDLPIRQKLMLIIMLTTSVALLLASAAIGIWDSVTARERLAKVAGILIAYPDIKLEIDGYTDNTGTASYNQQLSEQRAASVQAYLTREGVPASSITTRGFGMDNPIASNDAATGRQQNRRVELVVSGRSIGTAQLMP